MTARDTLPVSHQVLARQYRRHRLNQANWVLAITAAHNVGALRAALAPSPAVTFDAAAHRI
jgi:hypothetical protein